MVPALKGETGGTDRELVFCHYWGFGRVEAEARTSIRDLRWKLYDDGLLYDLEADLEEKHPLRLDHGDETTMAKRRELQAAMDSILGSVD